MVPARSAGRPEGILFSGARGVVSGGQGVEATGRETELRGSLGRTQRMLPEAVKHMADEGGGVTMAELLRAELSVNRDAQRPNANILEPVSINPILLKIRLFLPDAETQALYGNLPAFRNTD